MKITDEYINQICEKQKEYLGENKPINKIQPLLSIFVTTYQHSKFIRECLDSLLMQQTNFPFEIVVGEDESTDGTREICKKYAEQNPDKIRLYLRNRKDTAIYDNNNNFVRSINSLLLHKSLKGVYVAICEGDDYWTDPYKLQKQVDFLEKNRNYSAVCHNVKIIEDNQLLKSPMWPFAEERDITFPDLVKQNLVSTLSLVFRKPKEDYTHIFENMPWGDYIICLYCANKLPIKYLPETMGVYRKHVGGVWTSRFDNVEKEIQLNIKFVNAYEKLSFTYPKYKKQFLNKRNVKMNALRFNYLKKGDVKLAKKTAGKMLHHQQTIKNYFSLLLNIVYPKYFIKK